MMASKATVIAESFYGLFTCYFAGFVKALSSLYAGFLHAFCRLFLGFLGFFRLFTGFFKTYLYALYGLFLVTTLHMYERWWHDSNPRPWDDETSILPLCYRWQLIENLFRKNVSIVVK
jgi:hypothetical protein